MPSKSPAKTKLVPKRGIAYGLLLLLAIATSALVALYFNDAPAVRGNRLVMPGSAKTYSLLVARTPEAQKRGLGNRNELPRNVGMLFVHDNVSPQCYWMKDMRFPIDIIWTDPHKTIVAIEPNVQPDNYPQTYCADAQYVIELNAGEAAKNNLHVSQKLSF